MTARRGQNNESDDPIQPLRKDVPAYFRQAIPAVVLLGLVAGAGIGIIGFIENRVNTAVNANATQLTGAAGAKGEQGPIGPMGATGPRGDQGNMGPSGPRGDRGPEGPKGEPGPKGQKGPKGDTGPVGPRGEKGDRGERGNLGPRGVGCEPGLIMAFGGPTAPTGWLPCDGRIVNEKTYSDLYRAIGTSWGPGDKTFGSFNLPGLNGMFLRGSGGGNGNGDPGPRYKNSQLTEEVGEKDFRPGTFQGDAVGSSSFPWSTIKVTPGGTHEVLYGVSAGETKRTVQASTSSPETRPRNAAVLWVIKF